MPGIFYRKSKELLKKCIGLKDFLKNTYSVIKECTPSSQGFPTIKPSLIVTNFRELKEMDPFGRGSENRVPRTFSNMKKSQRQKTL